MPLTLSPGPKLTRYDWGDESLDKNAYLGHDVTAHASHHLFDVVKLDPEVTLRDIFLLLDTDTLLQEVYAREWVKECLAEVMRGRSTDIPAIEYDPEGIEYLELYQVWSLDSYTQELQPIHHLQFHGIGFVLQEDVVVEGHVSYRAGDRIKWSVSCTSPLKLLHLPVRINPEVIIREYNVDSIYYGDRIGRMLNPSVTLGQVLHGVLWELSFHGAPSARNEVSAKLKSLASDIGSETLITHQTTDLFADYKATFVSCFIDTANCPPDDLFDVLEQIGDLDHAEMELRGKLHAEGNIAWTNARYDDFNEAVGTGVASRKGRHPINVPDQVANLRLHYKITPGWQAGIGARYVASVYANNANTMWVPSYTLFDVHTKYRVSKNADVVARIRNLTNETYARFIHQTNTQYYVGEPRSLEVALHVRF